MAKKKYHRPVAIAKTANEWKEIQQLIHQHIALLVGTFENPEQATALTNLLFILTDEDFDPIDRSVAAEFAIRTAFSYSDISLDALRDHVKTLLSPESRVVQMKAVAQ